MLESFGFFIVAVYFVSQCSTSQKVTVLTKDYIYRRPDDLLRTYRPPPPANRKVTVLTRDYTYARPKDVLVTHIQRVIDRMADLKAHPRIYYLYDLLKKDIHQGSEYPQRQHTEMVLFRTVKPKYDVNKLNRY